MKIEIEVLPTGIQIDWTPEANVSDLYGMLHYALVHIETQHRWAQLDDHDKKMREAKRKKKNIEAKEKQMATADQALREAAQKATPGPW